MRRYSVTLEYATKVVRVKVDICNAASDLEARGLALDLDNEGRVDWSKGVECDAAEDVLTYVADVEIAGRT
jgi:hypothetical protein